MRALSKSCIFALMGAMGASAFGAVQKQQNFDTDPGWEGSNNRQGLGTLGQDFGFSNTNNTSFAGSAEGEAGGHFRRGPSPSYYADNIGPVGVTVSERLTFSGNFTRAAGGGEHIIAFFNKAESDGGFVNNFRLPNSMGFKIDGIRFRFMLIDGNGNDLSGPPEVDLAGTGGTNGDNYSFVFDYVPAGVDGPDADALPDATTTVNARFNGGALITNTLTNPSQLAGFAPFDRFGLHSKGADTLAESSMNFFDDLNYSAEVPEPASLGLLGLGGLLALRRRR